jgi:hypothetical protein
MHERPDPVDHGSHCDQKDQEHRKHAEDQGSTARHSTPGRLLRYTSAGNRRRTGEVGNAERVHLADRGILNLRDRHGSTPPSEGGEVTSGSEAAASCGGAVPERSPPATSRKDRPEANKTRPGKRSTRTNTPRSGSAHPAGDTDSNAGRLRAAGLDATLAVDPVPPPPFVADVAEVVAWPVVLNGEAKELADPLPLLEPEGVAAEPPLGAGVLADGAAGVQVDAVFPTLAMSACACATSEPGSGAIPAGKAF